MIKLRTQTADVEMLNLYKKETNELVGKFLQTLFSIFEEKLKNENIFKSLTNKISE